MTPAKRLESTPAGTGGRWPPSWAVDGQVPARPAAVARPSTTAEVAAVLRACHELRLPVTAFAGRSGVCGASVPVFGGVSLDLRGLDGMVDVDDTSLLVDVRAGTFGDTLEETLQGSHDLTLGHWPQSIAAVDRRRLAGLPGGRASTRRATGRSRTWSSAWRWRWPTAG